MNAKAPTQDAVGSLEKGLVIFLAPTVSLVIQQATVFRKQIHIEGRQETVAEFFGMSSSDSGVKPGKKLPEFLQNELLLLHQTNPSLFESLIRHVDKAGAEDLDRNNSAGYKAKQRNLAREKKEGSRTIAF